MGTNVGSMEADAALNNEVQKFVKSLKQQQETDIPPNVLAEARLEYGVVTYKNFLKNKMLVVQSIRHGLPYSLFKEIQKQTPFTEDDWADYLNLSTKSLQRYKAANKHLFKPIHSEKIFELAEVTELGKEVFGDSAKFFRWLYTPNMALAGNKPSDLIKNSYGKELVIDVLHNIDQGIFV